MAIKVSKLVEMLSALPPEQQDLQVMLATDDEGNYYRGLEDWVTPAYTEEENLWRIEHILTADDWDEWQRDYDDETVAFVPNVVVLG